MEIKSSVFRWSWDRLPQRDKVRSREIDLGVISIGDGIGSPEKPKEIIM